VRAGLIALQQLPAGKRHALLASVEKMKPGRPVATTALFHPPYLLRTPGQKRLAWRDLLALCHKLDDPGG
jgi:uracil-DNA glycosylase